MQGFDDFFDDIWNHLKLNAEHCGIVGMQFEDDLVVCVENFPRLISLCLCGFSPTFVRLRLCGEIRRR